MQALIVEDDEILAFLWKETLSEMEFEAVVVTSCEAAKEYMSQQSFDFYLLDFYVEDGTTNDLANWIKVRSPEAPVLVLTGSAIYPNGEHAFCSPGADWFLRKPVKPFELCAIVGHLMRQRPTGGSASRNFAPVEQVNLKPL